jgi:ketosteroid isomerase-like protein
MTLRRAVDFLVSGAILASLGACGPQKAETTLPDESQDLLVSGGGMGPTLEGTEPASPDLAGSQWRWVEAHCTEGPLDLSERGFTQEARVSLDAAGLLIVYDQAFSTEACTQTIAQRAVPGESPDDEWQMSEEAHVALPPGCGIAPEKDRPGNVRLRDGQLEVYVQRSNWCNGLEVRMIYERMNETPLEPDQLVRHYAAHFNRQDVDRLGELFARTGSLVEPFTESATGVTRHDGSSAVRAWFSQAFANVSWLALRLTSMKGGEDENQRIAEWEYMDPRVAEPFSGRNYFTTGGGEIFETRIELDEEPTEASPEEASRAATPPGQADRAAAEDAAGAEGDDGEEPADAADDEDAEASTDATEAAENPTRAAADDG